MPAKLLFLAALLLVALPTPLSSPAVALLLGAAFGWFARNPWPARTRTASRWLLQAAIVGLGFAMDLRQVLRAGATGFIYTIAGIGFALLAGFVLAKLLRIPPRAGYLISVGTAICGGSAIAAVGPVMDASDEEMSIAIGTVFLLNAAGLVLFPPLGRAMGLSEPEFGLWAALAIHDTSSVVGAATQYGALALAIATAVKLARALWIVPLALATAAWRHTMAGAQRRIEWPWFIALFLMAAALKTYWPAGQPVYTAAVSAAQVALTITLFLIGTGISQASLKQTGARPLVHGVLLWAAVAAFSLGMIWSGWIELRV